MVISFLKKCMAGRDGDPFCDKHEGRGVVVSSFVNRWACEVVVIHFANNSVKQRWQTRSVDFGLQQIFPGVYGSGQYPG